MKAQTRHLKGWSQNSLKPQRAKDVYFYMHRFDVIMNLI